MRIRIVSDGTAEGTHVVDAATGDVIDNVVAVSWSVEVPGCSPTEATFKCAYVEVDIESEAKPELEAPEVGEE